MKTFKEFVQMRELADPTHPSGSIKITPKLQQAASDVATSMPQLMANPELSMADNLKKRPTLAPKFAKKLLQAPAAQGLGADQINLDTASQLLMGKQ